MHLPESSYNHFWAEQMEDEEMQLLAVAIIVCADICF